MRSPGVMAMPHRPTDDGTQVRRTVDSLAALDGAGISRHQVKIMFVSGMGFLADAYDLFVIGIVVSLLKSAWALSTSQVTWLTVTRPRRPRRRWARCASGVSPTASA